MFPLSLVTPSFVRFISPVVTAGFKLLIPYNAAPPFPTVIVPKLDTTDPFIPSNPIPLSPVLFIIPAEVFSIVPKSVTNCS